MNPQGLFEMSVLTAIQLRRSVAVEASFLFPPVSHAFIPGLPIVKITVIPAHPEVTDLRFEYVYPVISD